jgi:hypothetical protein
MTGHPNFNREAFAAVTKWLREDGHQVFSPAEQDVKRHDGVDILANNPRGDAEKLTKEHGFSLRHALRDDLCWIAEHADCLCHLPNWEASRGSAVEHHLAVALGLKHLYISDETLRTLLTNGSGQRGSMNLGVRQARLKRKRGELIAPLF